MPDNNDYCVLTMPLHTEPWQEHTIETRFKIIEHLKNQLIAMELRKLKNVKRTRVFKELEEIISNTPKEQRKKLYDQRRKILRDAGFNEFAFKDDMAGVNSAMQKHFAEHIAAQIAHKAASDVWRSFDKYLYGSGREVNFHKRGTLDSVACQKAGNGMSYNDGVLIWSGGKSDNQIVLSVKVSPPETEYEKEMLQKQIKSLRIVRKWMKTRYKYYLQFTIVGSPVKKERTLGDGNVGIDIGTQTIAIVSNSSAHLLELADRINKNHVKKLQLQRKMDRSKRHTNPCNYNSDGTIKKSVGGNRLRWNYSKKYMLYVGKVRELERKNADIRKYQHICLANDVLASGNRVFVEKMNFSSLQRRAKETKQDVNGRFLKKKRFGKSLANKAPAMFISILESKLNQYGGQFNEVNTTEFKASQYDHTTGEYTKHFLSERWRTLGNGDTVQRDLYSAFLLMNSSASLRQCDSDSCSKTYSAFKINSDAEIARIKSENKKHISSFGIA